jgi:hypothetical protein
MGFAADRKNLSVEDIISGFQNQTMFYSEVLLENEKYRKAFNKCLNSKPADFSWIRHNCKKNPEFKNVFQCTEDNKFTYLWYVYETEELCEEVRKPVKDKMDAYLK